MTALIKYSIAYFREVNRKVLLLTSLFTALLIFLNYYYNLDARVEGTSFYLSLLYHYWLFFIAFLIPYLFNPSAVISNVQKSRVLMFLFFIAPAIFSFKAVADFRVQISDDPLWNNYWDHILYWPFLLVVVSATLYLIRRIWYRDSSYFGLSTDNFLWKSYLVVLLMMIPLIAIVSTQPDFLEIYPKLRSVTGLNHELKLNGWYKLLFELSYGSDFITIELFFRGFLVLAFLKWFGKDTILPMACFYCTIHFGKPITECISSYFGGILLGIIIYNTRSILGGLVLHVGVAWLMEIGGYLGNFRGEN